MDRADIRQTLVQILENDLGQDFSKIEEGQNLRDELGLDSVDVVSVVSQVERKFRIRLSPQELETLVTVGDLLTLLESKLQEPPQTRAAA